VFVTVYAKDDGARGEGENPNCPMNIKKTKGRRKLHVSWI
jgi:hypothetical protein